MILLLMSTGYIALTDRVTINATTLQKQDKARADQRQAPPTTGEGALDRHSRDCLHRFALPQIVLSVLALTSFHVQVITRVASGYPVWYIMLAMILSGMASPKIANIELSKIGKPYVKWATMYILIQGGLYASFMPPA